MYSSVIHLRQVILIPYSHIVNMLCYEDIFNGLTFIQNPYHLDISWPHRTI